MKAKFYKKIRRKAKWFDVYLTTNLFGNFSESHKVQVLAYNHLSACERAQRRGFGADEKICFINSERLATWKVKRSDKSDDNKNFRYF